MNQLATFERTLDAISYQNHKLHVLDKTFWIEIPNKIDITQISTDTTQLIKFVVDKLLKNNDLNTLNADVYLLSTICSKLNIRCSYDLYQDMIDYYHYGNDSLGAIPEKKMNMGGQNGLCWISDALTMRMLNT